MTSCIPCQTTPVVTPNMGVNCGEVNSTAGDCALNADGTPIVTATAPSGSCVGTTPNGLICPSSEVCSPWDLTQTSDTCEVDGYIAEQLNIAGANLNVYKLLGVHEQGKLIDLANNGNPISSLSLSNFPPSNAFDKFVTEWRSAQTGANVLSQAYIGYDFGPIKLNNGQNRYGIETAVKHDIAMIKIKQGCEPLNRVTKIRVEHSNDGSKWYGAAILDVQDCDGLITLPFKKTVPSRFWRIRPLAFNGGIDDYWTVQALQLLDYEQTSVSNIQDRILLENRDRDYLTPPLAMKCYYTPIDVTAMSSKYGMWQTDSYTIQVSFGQVVALLGRPFIIGDIIELPSEKQYTPTLQPVLKYLEVTDVAWSSTSYTAAWTPTMLRLIAAPAFASQETQQIFGKLTADIDPTGLVDINDGNAQKYQDISNISKTIKADANTHVPERGQSDRDISEISYDTIEKVKHNYPGLNLEKLNIAKTPYSDDAMPPNGLPYTQGETYPLNPKQGDYHRLTYESLGKDIAPRLFKYTTRGSGVNKEGGWILIAVDRRYALIKTKPILQEFVEDMGTGNGDK